MLLFFLGCGQILTDALGIGLLSFQVVSGTVLFRFALTMIFGEAKQDTDQRLVEADADLRKAELPSPAVVLVCVLLVAYAFMLLAGPIIRLIGNSGPPSSAGLWGWFLHLLPRTRCCQQF